MTKFEQQVANVLEAIFDEEATHVERSTTPREFIRSDVARRVAAAITEAVNKTAFYGALTVTIREKVCDSALAALRGTT